jgi:hypothetical protein
VIRKLVLLITLTACTTTATKAPALFEFHNNFWLNLHHFVRVVARGMPVKADLTPDERAVWDSGVAFYKANYAQRDLLLDEGMVRIKTALRAYEGKESIVDAPIDPQLRSVLEQLAPIYRKVWWERHEASNRAWIEAVKPLLDEHGSRLAARIAGAYGVKWPARPIPVDLSVQAGPVCAYTTSDPTHTTIASTDPGCQNLSSLEILFHEESHPLAGKVLQRLVGQSADAHGRAVPPQLWHAVLFYNAGELTRRSFAERGVDYVEIGLASKVYPNLCGDACRERVAAAWDPRLAGAVSIEHAVDTLVSSWPSAR